MRKCAECGTEFEPHHHLVTLCSDDCRAERRRRSVRAYRKRVRKERPEVLRAPARRRYRTQNPVAPRECPQCKSPVLSTDNRVRFCSDECAQKARSKWGSDYLLSKETVSQPYVYKATLPDGAFYIGSSHRTPERRLKQHFWNRGTGLSHHADRNGFTIEDVVFEVISHHPTRDKAYVAEMKLLAERFEEPLCINRRRGR